MSLVSTHWLNKNIKNVKIIDSSWHMPNIGRDALQEYKSNHIPLSIFFDINKYSNKDTDLPHMLPKKKDWELIVSSMGIKNEDSIVIYDNSDVISSCRCWFSFLYFGHNKNLVHVLDGGLNKWKSDNYKTDNKINKIIKTCYIANENKDLVKNINQVKLNIKEKSFKIIDGRSLQRFNGEVKEPRIGVRSGSIPNSFCVPYQKFINKDYTFKKKSEITAIFRDIIEDQISNNLVFTCGSGITACVLALAYSLINNNYNPKIYDGSWAEYGKISK